MHSYNVLLAIAVLFVITACGGSGGDYSQPDAVTLPASAAPPPPTLASKFDVAVFRSIFDPRILGGELEDGEQFVLQGTKSDAGEIESVDTLFFVRDDLEFSTLTHQPDEGRFVGLTDGVQVTIEESTNGFVFGLEAGEQQLNIDLGGGSTAVSQQFAKTGSGSNRSSSSIVGVGTAVTDPNACISKEFAERSSFAIAANAPVTDVILSGCFDDGAAVKVIMTDERGEILDVVFGVRTGPDRFTINIPLLNTADQAFAEAAQHGLDFMAELGVSEDTFSSILVKLKGETLSSFVDSVVKSLQDAGREAETIEQFAEFLNLTPDDVDLVHKRAKFKIFLGKSIGVAFKAYDVFDKLLKAAQAGQVIGDFIDAYAAQEFNQIQLQPIVRTMNGQNFSGVGSGLVDPDGPYPELAVNVPGKASISTLIIDPSSPTAGQSYTATSSLSCLVSGDVIQISIVGSDGFSDSKSQTVGNTPDLDVELAIPGADQGVNDTVTVKVTRVGKVVAQKTVSLVFGA